MILAVTENAELVRHLEEEFAAKGDRVASASSSSVGLARLLLDGPDLVVCDTAVGGWDKIARVAATRSIQVRVVREA